MNRTRSIAVALLSMLATQCLLAAGPVDEARKKLDADIADIRKSGQPATVEDMPKAPATVDAQNALSDLRAAFKALDTESEAADAYSQMELRRPLDPNQILVLQQITTESKPAIELIARARTKKLTWDIAWVSPLSGVKLPDLGQQRQVALTLFACALGSHTQSDDQAALARVSDMLYLAGCADQQGILISHLVALAITGKAVEAIAFIAPNLQTGKDSAARQQCAQLIKELLDESAGNECFVRCLCNERVFLIDSVLAFSDGRVTPAEVRRDLEGALGHERASALPDDDRLRAMAVTEVVVILKDQAKLIAAASRADWPTARASLPRAPNATEHPWAAAVEPSHERIFAHHFKDHARRRLAASALAIRCYAQDHQGNLPAALPDLVPGYLPAVPADPFAPSTPLRYDHEKATVTSIGPDGNDTATDPSLVIKLR